MKTTSYNLMLLATAFTAACSTASAAANENLCGRAVTTALIEQDEHSPPMWLLPDTGTYADANGDPTDTKWKNLREYQPKTLTLHCYFNSQKTDTKTVSIDSAKTCTFTTKGIVTCQ